MSGDGVRALEERERNALMRALQAGVAFEERPFARLGEQVETLPKVDNAQKAIGVEALDEFAPLIEHIGL